MNHICRRLFVLTSRHSLVSRVFIVAFESYDFTVAHVTLAFSNSNTFWETEPCRKLFLTLRRSRFCNVARMCLCAWSSLHISVLSMLVNILISWSKRVSIEFKYISMYYIWERKCVSTNFYDSIVMRQVNRAHPWLFGDISPFDKSLYQFIPQMQYQRILYIPGLFNSHIHLTYTFSIYTISWVLFWYLFCPFFNFHYIYYSCHTSHMDIYIITEKTPCYLL